MASIAALNRKKKSGPEAILQRFKPVGFSSPGLTATFDPGSGAGTGSGSIFERLLGQIGGESRPPSFNLSRSAEGERTIAGFMAAFQGRAAEFGALRADVRPGFGRLTRARVEAIRGAGQRAVGNLREELGRRRVLGSTFASREIASTEAEFGRLEESARAESFLQELALTGELIKEEFSSLIGGFETLLQQMNFESALAASLATNASAQINANLIAQAEARAASDASKGSFLNNILGIAGTLIGGALGGPAGAAIGGSIGSSVGSSGGGSA